MSKIIHSLVPAWAQVFPDDARLEGTGHVVVKHDQEGAMLFVLRMAVDQHPLDQPPEMSAGGRPARSRGGSFRSFPRRARLGTSSPHCWSTPISWPRSTRAISGSPSGSVSDTSSMLSVARDRPVDPLTSCRRYSKVGGARIRSVTEGAVGRIRIDGWWRPDV